jgi:hypothetical protein
VNIAIMIPDDIGAGARRAMALARRISGRRQPCFASSPSNLAAFFGGEFLTARFVLHAVKDLV